MDFTVVNLKMAECYAMGTLSLIFLLTFILTKSVYNMELLLQKQITVTNETTNRTVDEKNRSSIVDVNSNSISAFGREEGEEIDLEDELKEFSNVNRSSTWTTTPTNISIAYSNEVNLEDELKESFSDTKQEAAQIDKRRFSDETNEDALENELKKSDTNWEPTVMDKSTISQAKAEDTLENELQELHKHISRSTTLPDGTDGRNSRGIGNKLKNMWAKMKGKQATGNWDLSTEEASQVFHEYYECITKRLQELTDFETGKMKPVHAIMALDGERITMKCTVCSRPDRDKHSQQALWQHIRRSDSTLTPLLNSKRVKQSSQGLLTIKEVQVEDAGQYTCLDSLREYVAIYQLDVKFKERRRIVKVGEPLHNVTLLVDHNLKVMTSWAAWGACDSCGVIGSQQRLGTCMVQKLNASDPVKPKDFPMLLLYPDGIPCHSTALPVRIRRLKQVHARYEETLVGPCNVACPTEPPPVLVTDSDGQLVETIPGGQLFKLGEKPALPTMVKRRVLFEPEGKHLILQCSDVERGSGVRWTRGKRRIDPLSIKRQTAGRVWVDSANRLHIAMLLLSDTAVYNCWERQRHVVAIKVLVVDGFNEDLKDYITYAGFGTTIFASLVACCCLFCGGGKKTAK